MGRWSHYDTDEERLPEGMERIAYDDDTEIYTYRDADGSIWEGAPGNRYGHLTRVSDGPPRNSQDGDASEPFIASTYSKYPVPNTAGRSSWRQEMAPLLSFLLLIGLFLIGVFWYLRWAATPGDDSADAERCSEASVSHVIQHGDTCWSLAKKAGVALEELLKENKGLDCDKLAIGSEMCLPKA